MKTASLSAKPTAYLLSAGRTPLHYAAMHGRVAAVEELVRQGASVREKDIRGGYTPLHLAADAGQCEAICKLAALGAPLEALSNKGWTPLALATFKVASRPPCWRHPWLLPESASQEQGSHPIHRQHGSAQGSTAGLRAPGCAAMGCHPDGCRGRQMWTPSAP